MHDNKPCPNCGHCPTCGRSNARPYFAPYYPMPYPWFQYIPPTYIPTPWFTGPIYETTPPTFTLTAAGTMAGIATTTVTTTS